MARDLSAYRWHRNGITLRPQRDEDWVHFYDNYFDSERRFNFYSEAEWPECEGSAKERFAAFLAKSKAKGNISLTAEDAEGNAVGSLDLYAVDRRHGTFQIAVAVCDGHTGKGYAKTMMSILLDYCFGELRLNKLNARVMEENEASKRLHLALGCKLEGVHRQMYFHNGRYTDEYFYGLTREDWEKRTRGAGINN
ncbi:MAG: GNAT family N-acetyltransferase [Clostridia bacterium]|nr:GNAT family N-acetyltransferase [Clostridia bacterium]